MRKLPTMTTIMGPKTVLILTSMFIFILLLSACAGAPQGAPQVSQAEVSNEAAMSEPASTEETVAESAPEQSAAEGSSMVTFSGDVLPIFENTCQRCHGDTRQEDGLRLLSYDEVMAGSKNGAVIIAGDPDNSELVQQVVEGKMPKRGSKLSEQQIQIIIDWVKAGAENN